MFPAGSGVGSQGPDHLTFDLADSSKLSLSFYGKRPGPGMKLEKLSLQFALHETGQDADVLEAYERLIYDAMVGDHTLFNTAEGIERLWEVSTPLLEDPPPVQPYARGSWGPTPAINELIAPRTWRLPFERRWRGAPVELSHLVSAPAASRSTAPGTGRERAASVRSAGALEHALEQVEVHVADELPVLFGQRTERAVLQRDASLADTRLVAVGGQGGRHPLETARRSPRRPRSPRRRAPAPMVRP